MADKKRNLNVDELDRDTIKRMAERYVTDFKNYTIKALAESYQISESTYIAIIRRAIVENIISYTMCTSIAKKSCGNQKRHITDDKGSPAVAYYDRLFDERFEYLKNHEDYSVTPVYVKNYISMDVTIESMADSCKLSPREMYYYIKKGAVLYLTEHEYSMFIMKFKKEHANDICLESKLESINSDRARACYLRDTIAITELQLDTAAETMSSEDEADGRIESIKKHLQSAKNELRQMIKDPLD